MSLSQSLLNRFFVYRDGMWELPKENWDAYHAACAAEQASTPAHKVWDWNGLVDCYCGLQDCLKHDTLYGKNGCEQCNKERQQMPTPTPRQTVTIEGVTTNFATLSVTLTRQQIEKAYEELNKTSSLVLVQTLRSGDKLHFSDCTFIVSSEGRGIPRTITSINDGSRLTWSDVSLAEELDKGSIRLERYGNRP